MNTKATARPNAKRQFPSANSAATIGFEEQLWKAADGMRGHVEPAEYKHVVLGLLFLKYLSDQADTGEAERRSANAALPQKVDLLETSFVVPEIATWAKLIEAAHAGGAADALETARLAIEQCNPTLRGILPPTNQSLSNERLAGLLEVLSCVSLGTNSDRSRDTLGRVYEYFLGTFASAEGRSGGEYYTPRSVVQLLVEIVRPFAGVVYDPCCGTAGMFVQSQSFIMEHGGSADAIRVFGQESSATTWRLARMNLAVRGISANLGSRAADTFSNDLHPELRADYVLANPPFNAKEWGATRLVNDRRWKFGIPPGSNANYAWLQHIFHHLSPNGLAGVVLSNGALSSDVSGERQLRRAMVDADIVECVISLPGRLFYGTQIPASLWFISPNKGRYDADELRGQTLFIDARGLGNLVDRVHAELSASEIALVAETYHKWRACKSSFKDVPGLARAASIDEIKRHKYALVPGRYVGFARNAQSIDVSAVATEISDAKARLLRVSAAMGKVTAYLEALDRG